MSRNFVLTAAGIQIRMYPDSSCGDWALAERCARGEQCVRAERCARGRSDARA